jgi:hypothetical protein
LSALTSTTSRRRAGELASWRDDQQHGLAGVYADALGAQLDYWSELSDPNLLPAGVASRQGFDDATRCTATAAAKRVTYAAYEVRRSLVNDEPHISHAMTDWFARDVLGFRLVTPDLIDAAGTALLHAKLDDLLVGDADAIRQLRKATAQQRRCLRLLTETQLRGVLVTSLDQPFTVGEDGREVVLGVVVPSVASLDSRILTDFVPLVRPTLDWLQPQERQVALAYAGFAVDWPDAARMCGQPRSSGCECNASSGGSAFSSTNASTPYRRDLPRQAGLAAPRPPRAQHTVAVRTVLHPTKPVGGQRRS